MPRKKPEELKSAGGPGKVSTKPAAKADVGAPTPTAPVIQASAPAPVTPPAGGFHAADVNGV